MDSGGLFYQPYFFIASLGVPPYSVMQSDGNSFYGDVVSDSFNKTSWDEDNIADQIAKGIYVRIFIMMILILYNIIRKCILVIQ